MGVFSKVHRRQGTSVDEAETVARYRHLLQTLPPEVSTQALEAQFRALPLFRRQEILEQLRPYATAAERDAAPEPAVLAQLMLRAELGRGDVDAPRGLDPRDALDPSAANWDGRLEAMVARQFMAGPVLVAYFATAGVASLADQPAWVGESFGPDSAVVPTGGFDVDAAGGYNAGGFLMGGYDGGGFDGGGGGGGDGGGGGV